MEIVALVVAGIALVWQVGGYIAKRTETKLDDALFDHPEIRDAIVALVQKLLEAKAVDKVPTVKP